MKYIKLILFLYHLKKIKNCINNMKYAQHSYKKVTRDFGLTSPKGVVTMKLLQKEEHENISRTCLNHFNDKKSNIKFDNLFLYFYS